MVEKRLTGFHLKVLGIVLMVLDHIHQMWAFEGAPTWLTMCGRLVAPIFLFLAAEGVYYTRNRVAYLRNLLVGFWIMAAIGYFLPQLLPNDNVVIMNNIFGTLFISVTLMIAYDYIKKGIKDKQLKLLATGIGIILAQLILSIIIMVLIGNEATIYTGAIISQVFPTLITVEGGFLLVLLALLFYIFREKRNIQILILFLVGLVTTGFTFNGLFSSNFQWMMMFAGIPIYLYSGKEGRKMKWFFYIFYPAHIVILYILATVF